MQVKKKDGQLENFDREKISRGIVTAGASPETAEAVVTEVENWAGSAATEGVIATTEIRGKVLELLRLQDPAAATSFEEYRS